jgi:hypothetical protein
VHGCERGRCHRHAGSRFRGANAPHFPVLIFACPCALGLRRRRRSWPGSAAAPWSVSSSRDAALLARLQRVDTGLSAQRSSRGQGSRPRPRRRPSTRRSAWASRFASAVMHERVDTSSVACRRCAPAFSAPLASPAKPAGTYADRVAAKLDGACGRRRRAAGKKAGGLHPASARPHGRAVGSTAPWQWPARRLQCRPYACAIGKGGQHLVIKVIGLWRVRHSARVSTRRVACARAT